MNTYAFVQHQPIHAGFPQYSQPCYGPAVLPPLYYPVQVSPQLQPYYYASPQQQFYRLTPLLPLPLQGFPQQQCGTSLHVQYPQTGSTSSPFALGRPAYPAALQQPQGQFQQPHVQLQQPKNLYQQSQSQFQQSQFQQSQGLYQQDHVDPPTISSNPYHTASLGLPQNAHQASVPPAPQHLSQPLQGQLQHGQLAPPAVTHNPQYAAPPVHPQNPQGVPALQQPRALPTPPGPPPVPRYATRPVSSSCTPSVVDQDKLCQPAPPVDYQHAQGQPAPPALNRHAQGPSTPPQNDQHACGQPTPPVYPQHLQRYPTSPTHIQHLQEVPPPPRPPRRQPPPVTYSAEHREDVPEEPKMRMGGVAVVTRRGPAVEEWTRRLSSTGAVEGSSSTYARSTVSGSHGTQAAPLSTASQCSTSASDSAIPQNDMPEIPSLPEDDCAPPASPHAEHDVTRPESVGDVQPQITDGNLVYTVTRLLGRGSFGRVGKALIVRSGKCTRCGDAPCASHGVCEVAIKTYNLRELATNERIRRSYEQEIKAWKYITKKRARWLMHLWSVFTDNINSYLAMKPCCVSLHDVIYTPCYRDTFNRRAQRHCVEELVQGVEELHRLRMIHRDLKPDNVLIDEKGHIVITDFGLAEKAPKSSALPFCQVEFDGYGGSRSYMAPEVVACDSDQPRSYTCAADLWSLGVIIFEIFTGDRCFTGREELKREWDVALANMCRRTMCWVPHEAQMMILKLLEYDDKKRYKIEEVINDDFFRETDWNSISQKTTSEWIPPMMSTPTGAEDWKKVLEFPVYKPYKHKSWKCSSSLFH